MPKKLVKKGAGRGGQATPAPRESAKVLLDEWRWKVDIADEASAEADAAKARLFDAMKAEHLVTAANIEGQATLVAPESLVCDDADQLAASLPPEVAKLVVTKETVTVTNTHVNLKLLETLVESGQLDPNTIKGVRVQKRAEHIRWTPAKKRKGVNTP